MEFLTSDKIFSEAEELADKFICSAQDTAISLLSLDRQSNQKVKDEFYDNIKQWARDFESKVDDFCSFRKQLSITLSEYQRRRMDNVIISDTEDDDEDYVYSMIDQRFEWLLCTLNNIRIFDLAPKESDTIDVTEEERIIDFSADIEVKDSLEEMYACYNKVIVDLRRFIQALQEINYNMDENRPEWTKEWVVSQDEELDLPYEQKAYMIYETVKNGLQEILVEHGD